MVAEFTHGPDWEGSSGPLLTRQVEAADLWPHGAGSEIGGGNKDVLADGLHPILAIGEKTPRAINTLVGVVMKYNNASLVTVNVAGGFITRQYVSNILSYSAGVANSWVASMDAGRPVYIDDSAELTEGCTLSCSPLNSAGSVNPLAGYIWYGQDDYLDSGVGGAHAAAGLPVSVDTDDEEEVELWIMLKGL